MKITSALETGTAHVAVASSCSASATLSFRVGKGRPLLGSTTPIQDGGGSSRQGAQRRNASGAAVVPRSMIAPDGVVVRAVPAAAMMSEAAA
jgi:hypothetical protein